MESKYISIGERGYTMERCINCKFGISAANDKLPRRLADIPQGLKTKIPMGSTLRRLTIK